MNGYTGKPTLTTASTLENDGFFPNLSMGDLMTQYRIPAEYADDVIKNRLMIAMGDVNHQLILVKKLLSANYADMESYINANSETIGDVDIMVIKYEEAVFSYAKALLLQQFKTMNRKAEAENMAKESPETEHYWLNKSMQAVLFFFKKFGLDTSLFDGVNDVYVEAI